GAIHRNALFHRLDRKKVFVNVLTVSCQEMDELPAMSFGDSYFPHECPLFEPGIVLFCLDRRGPGWWCTQAIPVCLRPFVQACH
ncbi:MAG: hypothetical protein WBM63_04160, partial [Sedimenticolaceae bacterium]